MPWCIRALVQWWGDVSHVLGCMCVCVCVCVCVHINNLTLKVETHFNKNFFTVKHCSSKCVVIKGTASLDCVSLFFFFLSIWIWIWFRFHSDLFMWKITETAEYCKTLRCHCIFFNQRGSFKKFSVLFFGDSKFQPNFSTVKELNKCHGLF